MVSEWQSSHTQDPRFDRHRLSRWLVEILLAFQLQLLHTDWALLPTQL